MTDVAPLKIKPVGHR